MLGILVQACLDMEDWVLQVASSFDPDQAIGVLLAQRGALNGIQPQGGTPTIQNVSITINQALTLTGLDALVGNPSAIVYTVSDQAGTQWQLATTVALAGPVAPATSVTYSLAFQAAIPGATVTQANTIQFPVTIVVGVIGINNPTTWTTLGTPQETDAAFRIRRQQSTSIAAQGVHDALVALLLNTIGVTFAAVYENPTGATSTASVPGGGTPAGMSRNSIWVIVGGTATAAAIANAIYTKRNLGVFMIGAQSQIITQRDGTTFQVKWDNVVPQNLYIRFNSHSADGIHAVNTALIQTQLAQMIALQPGAQITINLISSLVSQIDPNCVVSGAGVSVDGVTYFNQIGPTNPYQQLVASSGRISITPI